MPETPNQEVERFWVITEPQPQALLVATGPRPTRDQQSGLRQVRVIALEDHQRLLRAVKEERDREFEMATEYSLAAIGARTDQRAAESRLEEVAQELERRIARCEDLARSEPDTGTGPAWEAAHQSGAEHLKGLRTWLQLLRDKGTDQGGGGS